MSWAWLTTSVLFLYAAAAILMLDQAPMGEHVAKILLTPGNSTIIVGYAELGQYPSAGGAVADHMEVAHDKDGWWINSLSLEKKVDAPTSLHKTRLLQRWQLNTGDRLQFGKVEVKVVEASPGQLKLLGPDGEAIWANEQLTQNLPTYDKCPDKGTNEWWQEFKANKTKERRLFTIGGQVPCAYRWHIKDVPAMGAEVLWESESEAYWLAPGAAEVRFSGKGESSWHSFTDLQLRLDDPDEPTTKIVIGRTTYLPTWNDKTLTLTPIGGDIWPVQSTVQQLGINKHKQEQRPVPRDKRVEVYWEPSTTTNLSKWLSDYWLWIAATIGVWIVSAMVVSRLPHNPDTQRLRMAATPPALACGMLTLSTIFMEDVPPAVFLISLGLAWIWGTFLLLFKGRLRGNAGLLWTTGLCLILAGALVQGQLGLGGDNSKWLRFARGHWLVLATVGWAILPFLIIEKNTLQRLVFTLVDLSPPNWQWRQWPWNLTPRWLRWVALKLWTVRSLLFPIVAGGTLMLQFMFGNEEGVWGIQPVEGVKTLIVLMLAHSGMRIQERRGYQGSYHKEHPFKSIFEFIWFFAMFAIFFGVALWQVHDMSPVLIVVLFFITMLWRLAPDPDPHEWSMPGFGLRLFLGLIALLAVLSYIWAPIYPESVPRSIPQHERIMVWADPARYPASGFQVNKAQTEAAAGGDFGVAATGPFGWNGSIMHLPVVQNDFIGAFVLNRLGSVGGIVLLWIQLMYIATLFAISRTATAWQRTQGPTGQNAGSFLSLAIFSLAWVFLAHSLIAWANVLGLLPVMGQPMTFIAAGGSHLLAFALPIFIFGLGTSWLTTKDLEYN